MSLNLPTPPTSYMADVFARVFAAIRNEDAKNRKVGQDIEMSTNRIILTATNGNRYAITVGTTGTLSTTLL